MKKIFIVQRIVVYLFAVWNVWHAAVKFTYDFLQIAARRSVTL